MHFTPKLSLRKIVTFYKKKKLFFPNEKSERRKGPARWEKDPRHHIYICVEIICIDMHTIYLQVAGYRSLQLKWTTVIWMKKKPLEAAWNCHQDFASLPRMRSWSFTSSTPNLLLHHHHHPLYLLRYPTVSSPTSFARSSIHGSSTVVNLDLISSVSLSAWAV